MGAGLVSVTFKLGWGDVRAESRARARGLPGRARWKAPDQLIPGTWGGGRAGQGRSHALSKAALSLETSGNAGVPVYTWPRGPHSCWGWGACAVQ